jgi:hypothetical protein
MPPCHWNSAVPHFQCAGLPYGVSLRFPFNYPFSNDSLLGGLPDVEELDQSGERFPDFRRKSPGPGIFSFLD